MKRADILVTADFIEHLSALHDLPIEIHTDRAYLRVGKTVFYARLSPVVARDAS